MKTTGLFKGKLLKVVATAAVSAFSYNASYAQKYDLQLIPYRHGDKIGYCDPQGKMRIKPQFTQAGFFEGAVTVVHIDSYYCAINRAGDIIYKSTHFVKEINNGANYVAGEKQYELQVFDEHGKAVTGIFSDVGNFNKYGYLNVTANYTKHGLLDKSFKEALPPKYGSVSFFSKGLVCIYDDAKKYGLFDLVNRRRFATEYDMIYPPSEGLMMVRRGDKYGFIDMNGKEAIAAKYEKETPERVKRGDRYNEYTYEGYNYDGFYNGLAVVVSGAKAGYIDKKGSVVIPFDFDKAFGFHGNFAWVMKDGKWGMINKHGKYILKPIYTGPAYLDAKELLALDGFHEGLISVAIDSLYGYADTTGKMVLPFKYTRAEPFHGGLAPVYVGRKLGLIDRAGKMVIEPKYMWMEGAGSVGADPFAEGCAIAYNDDGGMIIIDKNGKQIIPYTFDRDDRIWFQNGMASGKSGGKRYVFNNKGKIIYTFDNDAMVMQWSPDLFYNFGTKCYVNIKTGKKYCD